MGHYDRDGRDRGCVYHGRDRGCGRACHDRGHLYEVGHDFFHDHGRDHGYVCHDFSHDHGRGHDPPCRDPSCRYLRDRNPRGRGRDHDRLRGHLVRVQHDYDYAWLMVFSAI